MPNKKEIRAASEVSVSMKMMFGFWATSARAVIFLKIQAMQFYFGRW
jgi:hypothetical protein